jgi:hypothetical protein
MITTATTVWIFCCILSHPRSEFAPTAHLADDAVVRAIDRIPPQPLHMPVTEDVVGALVMTGIFLPLLVRPRTAVGITAPPTRAASIGNNCPIATGIFVCRVRDKTDFSGGANLSNAPPLRDLVGIAGIATTICPSRNAEGVTVADPQPSPIARESPAPSVSGATPNLRVSPPVTTWVG